MDHQWFACLKAFLVLQAWVTSLCDNKAISRALSLSRMADSAKLQAQACGLKDY